MVAVAALAGLGVYFAEVGLAQADQLASVLGLFVAAAGLGVAIFGLWGGPGGGGVRQVAKARGNSRTYQAGRDLIQRPSVRSEPGAGDGGLDSEGTDREGSRPVRQQARADDGSQVRQGGRDVIADADDAGVDASGDGDGSGR